PMPARKTFTFPVAANCWVVVTNCTSVSALHGPLITTGFPPVGRQLSVDSSSSDFFMCIKLGYCFYFFLLFQFNSFQHSADFVRTRHNRIQLFCIFRYECLVKFLKMSDVFFQCFP